MIIRDTLTANRTYYVRTDGSDSNNGLTNNSAGAFLTIQKAINVVCDTLDNMGYTVTIQVADGAYNAALTLKPYVGSGLVTLQGNTTTPANVTITLSTASTNCISAYNVSEQWAVTGFKLSATGSSSNAIDLRAANITFAAMDFGATNLYHIRVANNSTAKATGGYTISGSASYHLSVEESSSMYITGITVTLTGTPAFSGAFVNISLCSSFYVASTTFSGSATGSRYWVGLNGAIYTGGAGANYLPGNAAGGSGTGGQYF